MSKKALLVIDIQEDYTGINANEKARYKDADELIIKVNKIISEYVKNDISVVYIKQEFQGFFSILLTKLFSHGTAIKGMPGTEFDKRLKIVSKNCFSKSIPSAFSNNNLKEYLNKNKIMELDIVGLDGQFCVKETVKSAIKENFKVNLINDAILFKNESKRENVLKELKEKGVNIIY